MSTSPTRPELKRWEATAAMAPEEQLAVARLHQVGPPEALSDDAWQRIHTSLFITPRQTRGRRRTKFAALGMLGFGLAVAAGLHLSGRRSTTSSGPTALPPLEITGVIAPPAPPVVTPTIEPVVPEHIAVKPVRRSRPPAPSAGPSVSQEPLDVETAQLGKALRQLRIEKSPAAALETLQDYRRRFPAGLLSGEARLAELDADLALGHKADALQLLEGASPLGEGAQPREAELDLLHAELLVGLGRCGEARKALDRRIAANAGPARVSARALYLRALCAARDGDTHASRSDLEDYLRRFPDQADHRAVAEALQRMSAP